MKLLLALCCSLAISQIPVEAQNNNLPPVTGTYTGKFRENIGLQPSVRSRQRPQQSAPDRTGLPPVTGTYTGAFRENIGRTQSSALPGTAQTQRMMPQAAGSAGGSIGLPPVTGTYTGKFRENIGAVQPRPTVRRTATRQVQTTQPVQTQTYTYRDPLAKSPYANEESVGH